MFEKFIPSIPGLQKDSFDPKDVYVRELGAGFEELPKEYKIKDLGFEPQGALPFCVAFSVTKQFEEKIREVTGGERHSFSQAKLFYDAGGRITGSFFRSCLNVARKLGCVPYSVAPMPENIWTLDEFYKMQLKYRDIEYVGDEPKILGYARANGYDADELKRTIMEQGAVLVGVAASGGWWGEYTKRAKKTDNHACLLVGWDEHGWIVFDSLQPRSGFDGYHTLDKSYTFSSAYIITEVDSEDWRDEIYENRKEGFEHALNHYGFPRDFALEKEAEMKLVKEFKKFNNNSVWEAAGLFWTVYINAVAYGGYNVGYNKWGRWFSGDIINDCYNWRRTGEHAFDLNKLRSQQ